MSNFPYVPVIRFGKNKTIRYYPNGPGAGKGVVMSCTKANAKVHAAALYSDDWGMEVTAADVVDGGLLNKKAKATNPDQFGSPKVVKGAIKAFDEIDSREWLHQQMLRSNQIFYRLVRANRDVQERKRTMIASLVPETETLLSEIKSLRESKSGQDSAHCALIDEQIASVKDKLADLRSQAYKMPEFKVLKKQLQAWQTAYRKRVASRAKQPRGGAVALTPGTVEKLLADSSAKVVEGKKVIPTRYRNQFEPKFNLYNRYTKSNKPTWGKVLSGKCRSLRAVKLPHKGTSRRADRDSLYRITVRVGNHPLTMTVRLWNPPPAEALVNGWTVCQNGSRFSFNLNVSPTEANLPFFTRRIGQLKAAHDIGWREAHPHKVRFGGKTLTFWDTIVDTVVVEDGTAVQLLIPHTFFVDAYIYEDKKSRLDQLMRSTCELIASTNTAPFFENVRQWRSPNRLIREFHRAVKSVTLPAAIEDAIREMEHLQETANGLRAKMSRWLKQVYREFVARVQSPSAPTQPGVLNTMWYGSVGQIALDGLGLSDLAQKGRRKKRDLRDCEDAEALAEADKLANTNRRRQYVAVSRLQGAYDRSRMAKDSRKEAKTRMKGTSLVCRKCDFPNKNSGGADIERCAKCGFEEHHDLRGAANNYTRRFNEKLPFVLDVIEVLPNYRPYLGRKRKSLRQLQAA